MATRFPSGTQTTLRNRPSAVAWLSVPRVKSPTTSPVVSPFSSVTAAIRPPSGDSATVS